MMARAAAGSTSTSTTGSPRARSGEQPVPAEFRAISTRAVRRADRRARRGCILDGEPGAVPRCFEDPVPSDPAQCSPPTNNSRWIKVTGVHALGEV